MSAVSAITKAPDPPRYVSLVVRSQGGDREAFGIIYRDFVGVVHSVLLARVPANEVRDLVQDVFAIAWQRLDKLVEPKAFPGWLIVMAKNRAVDFLRARKPSEPIGDTASSKRFSAEQLDIMRQVKALPETFRETLLMRFVWGLTGPEIAERMGMTHGSVRVNLSRGMKLLRETMEAP